MYKIKLPNFEGPFDLMLYFIKRDELNIYDIPISRITEEFLNYIKLMQLFDLELAGDFIVTAAHLMYIKTQMLLPRADKNPDDPEEDPRSALVQRLVEYKQFRDASGNLAEMGESQRYIFYRKLFNDLNDANIENNTDYINANLFDLIKAFRNAIKRFSDNNQQHIVNILPVTIEEKMDLIMEMIRINKKTGFYALIKDFNKNHIIVTFLAILELLKSRRITVRQNILFDDFYIFPRLEPNPEK
jgi:segregation and condensation protein A